MKKFNLIGRVTISVFTEVEAGSLEQAIEIAKERSLCEVMPTGGSHKSQDWICDGELDGEVLQIEEA